MELVLARFLGAITSEKCLILGQIISFPLGVERKQSMETDSHHATVQRRIPAPD